MEVFGDLIRAMTSSLDLDAVLRGATNAAKDLCLADLASVALRDPASRAMTVRYLARAEIRSPRLAPVDAAEGLGAEVIATGRPARSDDYPDDPRAGQQHAAVARMEGVGPVLVAPIRMGGQVEGLVYVGRRGADPFTADDAASLLLLADHAAAAIRNARLYDEIAAKNAEMERINARLAESLKVQNEFLANVSHEFRSPLGGILGVLQLITDGLCRSAEEQRAFLAQARLAGESLQDTINNVLDLAKLDSGRLRVDLGPVDLRDVFQLAEGLFGAKAGAKGLTLHIRLPDPLLATVRADAHHLTQVLRHVVGNSLKFTERGGVTLQAVAGPQRDLVAVEVTDTGIGIASVRQARLFQRFVQDNGGPNRRHGGIGLGLVIAKALMEAMGGAIALDSRGEGMGTTVTLSLPLAGAREPALRVPRAPRPIEPPEAVEPPLVLIVDDDPVLRDVLEAFLDAGGFRTATAAGAGEALQVARQCQPALLIADLKLSSGDADTSLDGVDLVDAIGRDPALGSPPTILITGDRDGAEAALQRHPPAASPAILQKPVGFADLLAAVNAAIGRGPGDRAT
jgi:signal transduction histidine kinase/ActR/RegA family two-component response regulator